MQFVGQEDGMKTQCSDPDSSPQFVLKEANT